MSIIKKVLANVVQSLTRSEQTIAKKNIGLGDSVAQPPVEPNFVPRGTLVWDPDHTSVYRLLEDWSYTAPWSSITKKVRVMPSADGDPLAVDIDIADLNTNRPGTYALIDTILGFGKPYIRLLNGDVNEVIFEYAEAILGGGGGTPSYIFRTWQPNAGSPPTSLSFEQITVTSIDNVSLSSFTVNL